MFLQGNVPLHTVPVRLLTSPAAAVRACENICSQCTMYLNAVDFLEVNDGIALERAQHFHQGYHHLTAESIFLCCF